MVVQIKTRNEKLREAEKRYKEAYNNMITAIDEYDQARAEYKRLLNQKEGVTL